MLQNIFVATYCFPHVFFIIVFLAESARYWMYGMDGMDDPFRQ